MAAYDPGAPPPNTTATALRGYLQEPLPAFVAQGVASRALKPNEVDVLWEDFPILWDEAKTKGWD